MINIKKILFFILIILLSGCSNYKELNDLHIITEIAISKDDNYYFIYLKEATKSSNDSTSDYKYEYYYRKDKSIKKAINNLEKEINIDFYFDKLQSIIISDKSLINKIGFMKKYNNDSKIFLSKDIKKTIKYEEYFNYLYNIDNNDKNTLSFLNNNKYIYTYEIAIKNKKILTKKIKLVLN